MRFKLISLLPSVSMVRERDNARILFLQAPSKAHPFIRKSNTSSNFFHQLGHRRNAAHVALEVNNTSNPLPDLSVSQCPAFPLETNLLNVLLECLFASHTHSFGDLRYVKFIKPLQHQGLLQSCHSTFLSKAGSPPRNEQNNGYPVQISVRGHMNVYMLYTYIYIHI